MNSLTRMGQNGWRKYFVLFFLVWALVDMAVPNLCRAEGLGLPEPTTALATSAVHSQNGATPAQPQYEEDCFCCCFHISPSCPVLLGVPPSSASLKVAKPVAHRFELTFSIPHPPRG